MYKKARLAGSSKKKRERDRLGPVGRGGREKKLERRGGDALFASRRGEKKKTPLGELNEKKRGTILC